MYRILSINSRQILQRISDSASIPFDEANNDYLDYLKWVSEGNVAEEYQPEKEETNDTTSN
jgi:hypothetical protein